MCFQISPAIVFPRSSTEAEVCLLEDGTSAVEVDGCCVEEDGTDADDVVAISDDVAGTSSRLVDATSTLVMTSSVEEETWQVCTAPSTHALG